MGEKLTPAQFRLLRFCGLHRYGVTRGAMEGTGHRVPTADCLTAKGLIESPKGWVWHITPAGRRALEGGGDG